MTADRAHEEITRVATTASTSRHANDPRIRGIRAIGGGTRKVE